LSWDGTLAGDPPGGRFEGGTHINAIGDPLQTTTSLPQLISQTIGPLSLVAGHYLDRWLPGLTVPVGWTAVGSGGTPTTRMMLRRVGTANFWDGSEILNIYQVPGEVPWDFVVTNADRQLRDSGATDIYVSEVVAPQAHRTIGARAMANLDVGPRRLRAQYTYYVVNAAGGTALIEQAIVIGLDVIARLLPDVEVLTNSLHRSVLDMPEVATPPTPPASPSR
jgi:hypothetical protein